MTAYHDWDGDAATFSAAAEGCITSSLSEGRLCGDLREISVSAVNWLISAPLIPKITPM